MTDYRYDVEKNPAEAGVGNVPSEKRPAYVYEDGAVPGEAFVIGDSIWAKIQRFAGRFKIEQRGIERVPEDERTDNSMLNVSTMVCVDQVLHHLDKRRIGPNNGLTDNALAIQWLAANMVISSFAIGLLAKSIFFLGFVDAILVVLFFNLLGIMPVCFFSSFGPVFGLRQMIISRYWFGWHGVKLSMSAIRVLNGNVRLSLAQLPSSTSWPVSDGVLSM